MKLPVATFLFLSAARAWIVPPPLAASAAAQTEVDLPPCSRDAVHPCSCPAGTSYVWMQTFFSWGANAWAVRNLTGNFSDLSWVPQEVKKTMGPDNTVGSLRLTTVALDVGVFDWLEEITEYTTKDDGSFSWAFELKNAPIDFDGTPGLFAGEWERFEARAAGDSQTDIYWELYGCHTGGTHSFPIFQRYCHDHVHQTLKALGAIRGVTTKPYSEIRIGHRAGALTQPEGAGLPAYGQPAHRTGSEYVLARKGVRVDSGMNEL